MCAEAARASALVGPNPRGALGRVSIAVRRVLAGVDSPPLVGLSGGADSLALTLCAIDVASRAGLEVHTLTVDHGIRPESADEAARVAKIARDLGAIAHVVRPQIPQNGGPEASAREARVTALRTAALAVSPGAPLVLIGHTMDDQAETVLLRLARGSGARSLRAMSPDAVDAAGVRWIRPLLALRRVDTEAALHEVGMTWVDDPSNAPDGPWRASDGTPLRRAAVRAEALPALAEAIGLDPVPALARSAELAARDDAALRSWADDVYRHALVNVPEASEDEEDRANRPALAPEAMSVAPAAVRSRVIRRFLEESGARAGDLRMVHIDAVDALVVNWHGQGPVGVAGRTIRRVRDEDGRPLLVAERRAGER